MPSSLLKKAEDLINMAKCYRQQRETKFHNFNKLTEAIKNAPSIALIGNAGYLSNLEQGNLIDKYDLVIRMNNFKIKSYEKNVGEKIDIYLCCFYSDIDYTNPYTRHAKWHISSVPNNFITCTAIPRKHCYQITEGIKKLGINNIYTPSIKDYKNYTKKIHAPPSTGITAMLMIDQYLSHITSEIYITGFSFMEGKNHYFSHSMADLNTHNPKNEKMLALEIIDKHKKIGKLSIDPIMERYLLT